MRKTIKFLISILFIIILSNKFSYSNSNVLNLNTPAKQVILYDHELNKVLFEKNSNDSMKPASMAKVMTTYIVFDRLVEGSLDLLDKFRISERSWKKGGSRTFLELNSLVTVEDLLRGLIVQSGNDAAIALAEGISGSEEAFAREMNQYAKSLGMDSTNFTNSTGWPHPELTTTANDLIILTKSLIDTFPELYKLFLEKQFSYNNINQSNRNPLLVGRYFVNGADGLKTGHTNESGYGLIGSVKRNQRRITLVINGLNGKKQRAIESKRLLETAYRETFLLTLFQSKKTLASANVWLGKEDKVDLIAEKTIKTLITRPKLRRVKIKLMWDDPIQSPIKQNQVVGKILITIPGEENIETNLITSRHINELGPFLRLKSAFDHLLFGRSLVESE